MARSRKPGPTGLPHELPDPTDGTLIRTGSARPGVIGIDCETPSQSAGRSALTELLTTDESRVIQILHGKERDLSVDGSAFRLIRADFWPNVRNDGRYEIVAREEASRILEKMASVATSAPTARAASRKAASLLVDTSVGFFTLGLLLLRITRERGIGAANREPAVTPPPRPRPKSGSVTTTELVVNVKDADGKPIEDAEVTAGALGSRRTDKAGVADYGQVTSGTYKITAEKAGHAPKRRAPIGRDEKTGVRVPAGSQTTVDLVQHPECANVSFFEGSTTRSKYFGFDHKTNIAATANGEYWSPVPEKGTLALPANKLARDGSRWVSVAIGEHAEVEINFAFKGTECVPCIANSTFAIVPPRVAEVVTAKITGKKAAFKVRGKAVGEASLKVICDGTDIGWFHIWCQNEATLKLDVACIITNRAPAAAYSVAALSTHFNDIYRQALIKVDLLDLGNIDLTANAPLAVIESKGFPAVAGGEFLDKSGTPKPYDSKGLVLNALHAAASASLAARTAAPLARAGAYRLYWYVPTVGCSILGTVLNIGSSTAFGFAADSTTARNSCAHEFGHSLNLRHPSDGASAAQFAAHNRSTLNTAVAALAATNTEPASAAGTARSNVMANDPANLMGYWSDRPNRKPLRYHQWKAASRS